ncbi:hypothetical protein HY285_01015 [Candidatus Peregrinibacteria bacterium]|nr:hypothetical protein [Candidatus Peregrinibacteria bacterium]MBI3816107.1 hypothetical protein [Candidatus Peregrinibacteria bacterium]
MRRFLIFLGILLPLPAYAFSLPSDWTAGACAFLPCATSGNGVNGLTDYVNTHIVTALEVIFVAVAVVMLFVSMVSMIFYSTNESTVGEARSSLYYTIIGAAIVGLSDLLRQAFSTSNGERIVTVDPVNTAIYGRVLFFFQLILATALIANIVIQAIRLIASQGEQEQTEKARKRLIAGFIGVALVLLAKPITDALAPGSGSSPIAAEIAGIANFMLTIFGTLAVIMLIVAGILLVVSVDEQLKERAKTIIRTSIIALIIVLVAYALVQTFVAFSP